MQLATAGLVTLQPRRGAFVASLSLREIIERFEVMATLEGACGALAARRITDEERQELLEAHTRLAPTRRRMAMRTPIIMRTSASITSFTRHPTTLSSSSRRVNFTTGSNPTGGCQLRARSRVATSLEEHQGIVDAILAGEGDKAERLLKEHVLIQGERLTDFIASFDAAA